MGSYPIKGLYLAVGATVLTYGAAPAMFAAAAVYTNGASTTIYMGVVAGLGGGVAVGGSALASEMRAGQAIAENAGRLSKGKIIDFLSNVNSREELIQGARNIGLRFRGGSRDGRFMQFNDKYGNLRLRIDPADSETLWQHFHIYDRHGNSLNKLLQVMPKYSPEVHHYLP